MRQASWGPLRYRVPVIVVLLFLALAGVLVRGMRYAAIESYSAVERRTIGDDVRRAAAALDSQEDALRTIVGDWAPWDDTYEFMETRSPVYVESNLGTATLDNLGVDYMAFVGLGGRLERIAMARPGEVSPDLVRAVESVAASVPTEDLDVVYSGKILLEDGPALIAAAPITTSERDAVPRGVLVLGRTLRQADVAALSELTLLDVELKPPRSATPADEPGKVYIDVVDPRTATGRVVVRGLDGDPALRIVVTERRDAFMNAMSTLDYAGLALFGLVVLFGVGMYAILDVMVLRRLTQLHRELSGIGAAQSTPRRVSIRGSDEIGEVGSAINTTLERLEVAEEALRHAAHHDYLTDLENRRGFEREATRELAERAREGGHCALVLLDMDDFKLVNDTYGHQCGDRVLVQFSQILRTTMRAYSTVARLGGDEFAVLLPHTDRGEAMVALGRLNEELKAAPWECGAGAVPIRVGASAGVAVSPEDGETLDELVATADSMLYSWKTQK